MKILQVTSSFFPVVGGMEKVVYEVSMGLVRDGHDVTVLTTDLYSKDTLIEKENINGVKIIRFENKYNFGGYGYCPKAVKWIKENFHDYDIIHSHGYNRFLSEFAILKLSGEIPIVFSPHGFNHTKKHMVLKKIHDLVIGRKIGKANICTMLTELDLEYYRRLNVSLEKIVKLPNGVSVEKYNKKDIKRITFIKKKYNLDENVLLFVGRIHESKGLQYILKAIRNINCKLFIVGPDAGFKGKLLKQIKRDRLSKKVVFSGSISDEDLIASYHASDVFALYSEWEGFGLVVIEAMAAGKPVIVSDRGGLPFLVTEGKNGFVVPFDNIDLLKKRINYLLKNKNVLKKMGGVGKKCARKYDWKKITKQTLKIYKRAKSD